MKVKLTYAKSTNTDKNGNPLTDKNGKKFFKGLIKTSEHEGYISNNYMREDEVETMKQWTDGTEVDLDVFESEWQGKKYLNWKFPKKTASRKDVEDILTRIKEIEELIKKLEESYSNKEEPLPF